MNSASYRDLLSRYAAEYQPVSPIESLGNAGGYSGARLWRFDSERGRLLLRAWPSHGCGQEHIERVHGWLFATADLRFVPVPVRDRAGRSLQAWNGTLWEVTPWLAGTPDLLCPPGVEHLRSAFTGLALFHERLSPLHAVGLSSGLRQRHDEIRALVSGGFDSLERAILRQGDSGGFPRQTAVHWLSLARNLAPPLLEPLMRASGRVVRVQPVIRDARPEHFLFEAECLSGLIDFGAMGVDSVASDLARLIGEWLDGDAVARGNALAAYEQVRPLDPDEINLIGVFEAGTAVLMGERWIRWHCLDQRHFDDPTAVSRGLERGLNRLKRLAGEPRIS